MSQDTLNAFLNLLPALIALIPVIIVLVVILAAVALVSITGVILIVRQFVPALKESVPADFDHKSLDLVKTMLMFGLNSGAAKTETLDDDQALIKGLALLGATVTGNPEAGYTIVTAPKAP